MELSNESRFRRCMVTGVHLKSLWSWRGAFCMTMIFMSNNALRLRRIEHSPLPKQLTQCRAGYLTLLEGGWSLPYTFLPDGSASSSESISAQGTFARSDR